MMFWTNLAQILIMLGCLAAIGTPVGVGISLSIDHGWGWIFLGLFVSAVAFAGVITLGVSSGVITDDNSNHCGPGTTYFESEHLVGKVIVTDWYCTKR